MQRFLTVAIALIAGTIVPAISASAVVAHPANASVATTSAPAAGLGIRLAEIPTATQNDPRARVYIIDRLAPGAVISRKIEVSNGTASAMPVSLYPAAATISKGTFLGSAAHTANDLSSWTSVSPAQVTLPAGGKQIATVTVKVPSDAAPGEDYGVVWAEVASTPKPGAAVTQVSRVGIRMYVSIGPGGAPAANFSIDTFTAGRTSAGLPTVTAAVHNTGGRAIDLSGTLNLAAGPGGLSAGPFPVVLGTTVGIGDTEPVSATLDKSLPAGPWTAKITMKSGLLEISAQATITFPVAGLAPPVTVTGTPVAAPTPSGSSTPGWLIPVVIGTVVLLLIIIVLLFVVLRRKSQKPESASKT